MAERKTEWKDGQLVALKVAASTKIEAGKMVGVNSAGYAVEAADTAGIKVQGVAEETVDNSSGQNGDLVVRIRKNKVFKFKNSGTNAVDVADAGTLVFVEDDETVADAAGTNGVVAGLCIEVAADGVWVEIPAAPQVATQAASAAADVATLKTDFNALLTKLKAAGVMASA
jgi:hypothetical protein